MIYKTYTVGGILMHHGVQGMHWGVHNGPPYPLSSKKSTGSRLKTPRLHQSNKITKEANVEKWGKDKDHNTLYITGMSGSGKSTYAMKKAKEENAEYINLDSYLSPMSKESKRELQNKKFNSYLNNSVPGWRKVINDDSGKLDYKIVDKIAKASEEFSKELYKNKKKLIMEGVQLMDSTLYESRDSYKDKPYMVMKTSGLKSMIRGAIRDSDNPVQAIDLMIYRLPYSIKNQKITNELIKELNLK